MAGGGDVQAAALHVSPLAHARLHAPQFALSELVDTQLPEQFVKPCPQAMPLGTFVVDADGSVVVAAAVPSDVLAPGPQLVRSITASDSAVPNA